MTGAEYIPDTGALHPVSGETTTAPSDAVSATPTSKEVELAVVSLPGVSGASALPAETQSITVESLDISSADSSLQNDAVASVSVSDTISISAHFPHPFSLYSGAQSTNHVGSPDTQVPETQPRSKTLQATSAEPTLLDVTIQDSEDDTVIGHNDEIFASQAKPSEGDGSAQPEHLPEPPASPTSITLSTSTHGDSPSQLTVVKPEVKVGRTPSANRLSISYAGGNRRLVIDAEIVDNLKLYRQAGRIEVLMNIDKESDTELKGILVSENLIDRCLRLTNLFSTGGGAI